MKPLSNDNEERKLINEPFCFKEFEYSIEEMDSSTPGPNGLTLKFFKKFFILFEKYFLRMINGNSDLPESFSKSTIKLIPKNNNSIKEINDYRPITLTNFDYRIFAKVITKESITLILISLETIKFVL